MYVAVVKFDDEHRKGEFVAIALEKRLTLVKREERLARCELGLRLRRLFRPFAKDSETVGLICSDGDSYSQCVEG